MDVSRAIEIIDRQYRIVEKQLDDAWNEFRTNMEPRKELHLWDLIESMVDELRAYDIAKDAIVKANDEYVADMLDDMYDNVITEEIS